MKYKTIYDVYKGMISRIGALPDGLSKEDAMAWFNADAESKELAKLVEMYFDAEHNPPQGVIGVGAITYAQGVLQAAQNNA